MDSPPRNRSMSAAWPLVLGCWLAFAAPRPAQGLDPASDDFEHHQLGPSWVVYVPGTGIVNDSDLGSYVSGCAVGWVGSGFGADQYCQATTSADGNPDMLEQVFARQRQSDNARYGFHFNGDPGKSQWEIKYDGVHSAQTKILALLVGPPPAQTDTLRIEAFGADPVRLRGYQNDILKLETSDASPERITEAGRNGVVARMKQGMVATPPTPIFESWSGGSLHWIDLGQGLEGSAGVPVLSGTGSLDAGTLATLSLASALPGGTAILVLGYAQLDSPLLGGVLVPSPSIVVPGIPLDGSGAYALQLVWPTALANGFAINAQFWIADPAGSQGFAASNGLRITTL